MSTSSLNESFTDQKLLENFLRSTKLIKIIEEKTEQFIKTYANTKQAEDARAPIILELQFQFRDLNQRSPDLLESIVEEPLVFLDTAKYLIYSIVASILKENSSTALKSIDSDQIHVHCRFIGLPVQEDLSFNPSKNKYPGGLSVLCGVLSAYTEPENYTIQTVWYCTGCQTNKIKSEITRIPNCFTCSRPMNEYSKLRCVGKYRLLKVFPFESVSTPRILEKIFRSQVVRLNDYTYDCDLILGASMESNEAVNSDLSTVKSIPDADLDQLLEFTLTKDAGGGTSEFQYNQGVDIPLNTTDLFCDHDEKDVTNERTRRYAEFSLSFSPGPLESSLHLNSQRIDNVDLTVDSNQSKHEESIFVHPQVKDEPLDLSFQSLYSPSTSKIRKDTNNDFNLEFSAFGGSAKGEINESAQEDNPSEVAASSTSRRSPMELLTLSYSQTSLGEGATTANTRRDLHSSQSVPQIDTTLIPSSVLRLHETIKKAYSDFAFVYSLAAQMCQDQVPMDCFVHFKIGLLLSIASLEENPDRPPISVVAIGPEFTMANYLMEGIGNVAERFVGPDDDFKVPANKSDKHTWFEADPIIMARGGIFYVGDWSRLKAPRAFKFMKVVECSQVLLERTTVSVPLETAIWTHWRSYKYDKKDQHTFNKFLEIFGIPLIIEEDNHEVLVDLMLEQASEQVFESTIDELSIGDDDMREFLSIVSKRRVDLTNEASDILRKYFVASRIDRPDCLTQRSYSTLKLFAESFAKLSLRHEVIAIDAIAAVYMTENFIQNIFGPGVYPPPEFQMHSYIGAVDEHMVEFQGWVNKYIAKFHDNE